MKKRAFPRTTSKFPARIMLHDLSGNLLQSVEAEVVDISQLGFRLKCKQRISGSQDIEAEIDFAPHLPEPVRLRGKVIWESADGRGGGQSVEIGISCNPFSETVFGEAARIILEKANKASFLLDIKVFLRDTDATGQCRFASYFEWQGLAREAYFQTMKSGWSALRHGSLVTKRASMEYVAPAGAGDELAVIVQDRNIVESEFDLVFTFVNKRTGAVIARGEQTVQFVDRQGRPVKTPADVAAVIAAHLADEA